MSGIMELYQKHAPRWVKVIRWREWGDRIVKHQAFSLKVVYFPICIAIYGVNDLCSQAIAWIKPKNEEELMAIKRNWNTNLMQRNWEMGQYSSELPPRYDMWERRRKYPEYYEGRYDGFKRDHPPL